MILVPMFLTCGPIARSEATCETACGLRFVGEFASPEKYPADAPHWSCEALQAVELGVLARFPEVNDVRFRDVCPALTGYTVDMTEKSSFKDPIYGELQGLTMYVPRHITLANVPPDRSSLPHEIAHVVQNGFTNSCAHPGTDAMHACWQENGIFSAAANANWEAASRIKGFGP